MADRAGQRVAVAGHGLLATAISELLSADPRIDALRCCDLAGLSSVADLADLLGAADRPEDGRVLVTASDGWDCRDYERIQALCAAYGASWLPVHTELGRAVLGPFCMPREAGCVQCAELRRSLANEHSEARETVRRRHVRLIDQPSSWLTVLAARTVAALAAEEVIRSGGARSGRTRHALLYVDLDTLSVSTHRFLPDPLCPVCGTAPMDSPELARITMRPRPKPSPDAYRVQSLGDADVDRLRETYVDEETGLVRRVLTFTSGGLAIGAAEMRARHSGHAQLGWGRTRRYRTSEVVAVLEALERYGGMAPGGRQSVVRASFADVRDQAVDPRTLGLYSPEQYVQPGFPFLPFDADRECWWVWGYSFARRDPVLVPRAYAYYQTRIIDPDDPLFAFEISNGCALGSCLEEAILYGILEVVERDAFLMTWYARLQAARVDPSSARDRAIPMLVEAIEAQTGYQVLIFDTTMEHGIPSLWAMATHPPGSTGQPAVACAAGAHLDPERAASSALCELGPILTDLIMRYPDFAERGRAMVDDPALVVSMDDHSVLYARHEAFSRLDFLATDAPSRSFTDVGRRGGAAQARRHIDLTDDVAEVVQRLGQHGLDVVVVDQTTPEHSAGGLSCVKVIVPGMLPMTFGHDNRRVHGLPRLFEVPRLLRFSDRALLPQDVNPHPHPFP